MGMYWVCNPKKLGFYGYVLGMKPKKSWVLWVWVGYWVPYPIPTQKPNYFWVPMSGMVSDEFTLIFLPKNQIFEKIHFFLKTQVA